VLRVPEWPCSVQARRTRLPLSPPSPHPPQGKRRPTRAACSFTLKALGLGLDRQSFKEGVQSRPVATRATPSAGSRQTVGAPSSPV
jgi:hypothetical protein